MLVGVILETVRNGFTFERSSVKLARDQFFGRLIFCDCCNLKYPAFRAS